MTLNQILAGSNKPALLIGNGVNRFEGSAASSWEDLLSQLAARRGLQFNKKTLASMSNTEFFDILDLNAPEEDRTNLQKEFCESLSGWRHSAHHTSIVGWAKRHDRPIITVNFDENLSRSVDAVYFREKEGFTDYYPWSSYFSDHKITDARSEFAIWHPHGMQRYSRSVRLGLTHYMGSVQRARARVYGKNGLRLAAKQDERPSWRSSNTWLEVFFFCPILIVGFGFGKDETLFRWLFLERARIHKIRPDWRQDAWFVDTGGKAAGLHKQFLEGLGIQQISLQDYSAIYEAGGWGR